MYKNKLNEEDLRYVLSNLRQSDREELSLLYGDNYINEMFEGFKSANECYIGYLDNDKPFCVFGVTRDRDIGIIGFLSTDDIKETKIKFLRVGKKWIEKLNKEYKVLCNFVYSKNNLAIQWLKWLGFNIQKHYGLGNCFLFFYKGDIKCVER